MDLRAGKQIWSRFSEADSCRFGSITESCPNDFAAYPGCRQFGNRLLENTGRGGEEKMVLASTASHPAYLVGEQGIYFQPAK